MRTALFALFALAGGFAGSLLSPKVAADQQRADVARPAQKGYHLTETGTVSGLWVNRDATGPFGAMYSDRHYGHAVLGFSTSRKFDHAHDFAIIAEKDGVRFQVSDDKGKVHSIPASALLKLK